MKPTENASPQPSESSEKSASPAKPLKMTEAEFTAMLKANGHTVIESGSDFVASLTRDVKRELAELKASGSPNKRG